MNNKIKIVYLATPDIAIKSFEFFIKSEDYDVMALVVQPPKGQTRGKKTEHSIAKVAKESSITIYEPEKISKDTKLIDELKSLKPDFFVTFAFGQILSQEVIDIPKYATINLHASLLPKYRGANPIAQSIIDGCKFTGITTMKTVLQLDAGDICLQERIEIPDDMNVIELMEKISNISPDILDKTLKGLYSNTLKTTPQNEQEATFTKKLKKEEKIIDWNTTCYALHNKIRGMYKINTNHTTYNNKLIQILKTEISALQNGESGEILNISKEGITVKCSEGALKILTVKPEGKGEMNASDWANGARIKIGDKFI